MSIKNIRLEVMQFLESKVDGFMDQYLIPVDKIWQPSDFLPDSESDTFFEEVRELRELAKDLPYDFWVAMVGDTITEEALPTYESWLMDVEGVDNVERNAWSQWVRQWTGEENRHDKLWSLPRIISYRVTNRIAHRIAHRYTAKWRRLLAKVFWLCHNSRLRCRDGGIGRRTGLKIPRRKAFRFDSGSRHQIHT